MQARSLLLSIALLAMARAAGGAKGPPIRVIAHRGDHWTAHAEYPLFRKGSDVERLAGAVFRQDAVAAVEAFEREIADRIAGAREREITMFVRYQVELTFRSGSLVSGNGAKKWDPDAVHWFLMFYPRTVGLKNGRPTVLTLRDLLLPGIEPKKVASEVVVPSLNPQLGIPVEELKSYMVNQFVVTPKGLKWVFWPYQVGPYSEGFHEVLVPWRRLMGYIDPNGPLKPALSSSRR